MKRFTSASILAIIATMMAFSAVFASGSTLANKTEPFEGTFIGTVLGDRDSETAVRLELVQHGELIKGEMTLEDGLYIDGGFCWRGYLPEGVFSASGSSMAKDPYSIKATYTQEFNGVPITGNLDAMLSRDGETLTAEVEIDLPWFCGKDPVFQVSAQRQ